MKDPTLAAIYERAVAATDRLTRHGIEGVGVTKTRKGRTGGGELGTEVEIICPLPVLMIALEALADTMDAKKERRSAPFPTAGSIEA